MLGRLVMVHTGSQQPTGHDSRGRRGLRDGLPSMIGMSLLHAIDKAIDVASLMDSVLPCVSNASNDLTWDKQENTEFGTQHRHETCKPCRQDVRHSVLGQANESQRADHVIVSIAGVTITNSRGQTLLRISPNSYPATRYSAQRDIGDDGPVEYVQVRTASQRSQLVTWLDTTDRSMQDPESISSNIPPAFLVRLGNVEDLIFNFTFVARQLDVPNGNASNGTSSATGVVSDTQISGLTHVFGTTPKEVDNIVVREFHSNPNIHKIPNVELVGDYSTAGNQSVQFHWSWQWRPPKPVEDRGGGWRNCCSFVEYDQRGNRLSTLATFNFWVQNMQRYLIPRSPRIELGIPPRLRVPSSQSVESRVSNISDSEGEGSYKEYKEPQSPAFESIPENGFGLAQTPTSSSILSPNTVKVDVASCKPGEDPAVNDDGPLFRATMRSLEQKTGNMRLRMKKVLRTAEAAESAQHACNQAVSDFTEALREAASSNANAVKPALDHYFEKIAKEILRYERQNSVNLHKLIIDPISKLYNIEIKQADLKKREFDEESKEYYAYVSKYLGQRSESFKEKKIKQSDEKYQAKRRTFELKRFDYSSFMHDLHGGRKDQEVLSQLTKYADAQARGYLATAKQVEAMVPQLDALITEVKTADQDYQLQRSEREEKRRMLETSSKPAEETVPSAPGLAHRLSQGGGIRPSESEHSRPIGQSAAAYTSQSPPRAGGLAIHMPTNGSMLSSSTSGSSVVTPTPNPRFKGIRDLEDNGSAAANGGLQRKEGLLWALSRPGSHVDPKGITKPGWHKFWIVLDQGKLSEYVNWKEKLDLHMEPIDLRMASVREARGSDRRFCFEVITPQFTRVYQAPSEEDMKFWIAAINNALQSAFETRAGPQMSTTHAPQVSSTRKDIAAVLTGKSSSFSGHRQISNPNRNEAARSVSRNATTGEKPLYKRVESEAEPSALLQRIRMTDEGNKVCADCGSESKVDWCSINLGVLLCIECSGIHRSLGTHISKVRSLTLDTSAFTPDIIEVLMLIGNRVSNMVWEAKLDRFLKPSPHSTREQRLHFITAKYGERTYVQTSTTTQVADDLLLTSIKRNDIQSVLHALALRANPNAHDRSRSTHAVYLALAAADPAAPASSSFSHSHSSSSSTIGKSSVTSPPSTPSTPARKPFAVAELLLQNGANIPTEQAPIPLSSAARLYLDFKNEQRLGKPSTGTTDSSGDTLSALPSIAPSNGLSLIDRPKERERLVKRSSSGRPSRPSLTADAIADFVKKKRPHRRIHRGRSYELLLVHPPQHGEVRSLVLERHRPSSRSSSIGGLTDGVWELLAGELAGDPKVVAFATTDM
nr:putative ribosylation factor gtpase-activating protein cnt6 [Quercus suber]